MSLPIAVLVSGGGSNLQSIIDRIEEGSLNAEIKLVVSNKPEAFGLQRAKKHGIPYIVLQHTDYPDRESFDQAMVEALNEAGVNHNGLVVLAGFMRIVTPVLLKAFAHRVINIHPALLPSFPGAHGQSDTASYGVTIAGCTVHFVDEQMDHGPVIIQAAVPCLTGEDGKTLGTRILRLEHRVFPQAIQWIAEGRLSLDGRHVTVQTSDRQLAEQPDAAMGDNTHALVWPPLEAGF